MTTAMLVVLSVWTCPQDLVKCSHHGCACDAADSGSDKQHQGVFKPEEGKIDKRHGDPEAGGKTSGQKVSRLRPCCSNAKRPVLCHAQNHV